MTDKPYIAEIRDIVKGAGFTDVPLFQCDWNSNFENNALEDLVWTINFGTGANIDAQFKHPHQIVIDLGEDKRITGFSYLPRAEDKKPGMIKDFKVYIKAKPFKQN
ncbi:discoidin domain-containing protein [Dysgonomonas sp. 511]|uniref:discoidin domain-containing protein n=1 Tax=Dysgonomonas sp. 511 TaxID=2302930 RepID=UPI0013D5389B|nr:discoidin domain-containing protein [Dysgonomonas sp. 511]NDV79297.1 hypothetical protein [Dysgonomonas sp. 511]